MKYIASVSFGKDSLAMLLMMLKLDSIYKLDEVIFYDTGMEFQAIYNVRNEIIPILKYRGIKYTELKPKWPFEYMMFEKPVKHRNGSTSRGYSWCGGRCRWGTTEKNRTITKYLKDNYGDNYKEYIGIAYDELNRIRNNNHKIYPLIDLKMKEKDCLELCYKNGFTWSENHIRLYDVLDRVSCWCCANKNLKELKNYYYNLPKYWDKLKELQKKTDRPFKNNKYTIFDLEERFRNE